ncbi:hypothetical protein [Streptomyces sp. NPDC092370]|uniref:hypothetical protein n=1 Tax=Streptomyces sp. NPDC092370 TaxID=3366016 RepID=UPI00382BB0E2
MIARRMRLTARWTTPMPLLAAVLLVQTGGERGKGPTAALRDKTSGEYGGGPAVRTVIDRL